MCNRLSGIKGIINYVLITVTKATKKALKNNSFYRNNEIWQRSIFLRHCIVCMYSKLLYPKVVLSFYKIKSFLLNVFGLFFFYFLKWKVFSVPLWEMLRFMLDEINKIPLLLISLFNFWIMCLIAVLCCQNTKNII